MTFARANKKNESKFEDEYQKLLCTEPGCKNPWSVMIDRPKCSRHQWKTDISFFPPIPVIDTYGNDGLAWARKIVDLHKQGFRIRALTMRMACESLKIDNPLKNEINEKPKTDFAKKLKEHEYKPKPISDFLDDVF